MEESRGTGFPQAAVLGTTPSHWHSPGGDPDGEAATHQPTMSHHLFSHTSSPGSHLLLLHYTRYPPAVLDFISLKFKVDIQRASSLLFGSYYGWWGGLFGCCDGDLSPKVLEVSPMYFSSQPRSPHWYQ